VDNLERIIITFAPVIRMATSRKAELEKELQKWKTYRTISYGLRTVSVIAGLADEALVKILASPDTKGEHPFDKKVDELTKQIPIDVDARVVSGSTKQETQGKSEEASSREESVGTERVRTSKKGQSAKHRGF